MGQGRQRNQSENKKTAQVALRGFS